MENNKRSKDKLAKWLLGAGILMTIVSAYFRVTHGWDQDQSYMILLAERISDGQVLFRDLWDLHQTGAVLAGFLYSVYYLITGSSAGVGVFLRICSLVIQLICSVYTYCVLKEFYKKDYAFLIAVVVANFLPRASQQIEYSTVSIWSSLICALLLLKMRKTDCVSYTGIALAGFFYALSVFSYPTMILTVPWMAVILLIIINSDRSLGIKSFLLFFGVCILCVILLFLYLHNYMSVKQFILIIKEIGKSGDHTSYFSAFSNSNSLLKSVIRIIAILTVSFSVERIIKSLTNYSAPVVYYVASIVTVLILFLNLTGIRKSGPFGLLERYIAIVICGGILCYRTDKQLFYLFYCTGITYYLGALMGSNLGVNENAMYLEMSIIAVILTMLININDKESILLSLSSGIFIFGLIVFSGYFVRVDATSPANIFDCTSYFQEGALKGIHVLPEKQEEISKKALFVSMNTEPDHSYTILNRDVIIDFSVNGLFSATSYAATSVHNQQWVDYYDLFDHELPEMILIAKDWYKSINDFYDTEFGDYVRNSGYKVDSSNDLFFVLNMEG